MSFSPSRYSRAGENPEQLITDNLDIWTSAIKKRGSQGRGSSKKIELYGIKKLRELILDLAVRGLLVPQDPNDEPASVLLEKITTEKDKLVKEGKIKEQKKSKPFDVGEEQFLPSRWVRSDFGDITFNRDAERIPLSVGERRGRSGEYDYYGASGVIDSIDDYIFDVPLLLIGEDGANLVNRSTPIAFMAYGKYWVNNHAHVVGGISETFLKYLALYINSISLLPYITGMAQPKMNQAKMNSISVLLPPEQEMPRVLAKVDELMALCDQLEQQTEDSLSAHQTLVETLLNALLDAAQSRDDSSSKESAFDQAWQRIAEHFDVLFTTEYSIDQLKQTILQLAVMGKLVPQDPNDEPASVLLEKIAAEKKRLVKEGKIKKQKPLPEISEDEKPFELPVGWEWCRFDDIVEIGSGVTKGRKLGGRETVDVPYLRVANVQRNFLVLDEIKHIEIGLDELEKYQVKNGDLLITEGGDWDKVGRTAIWRDQTEYMAHQNHVFKARPLLEELDEVWLENYLNSQPSRNYFAGSSKQTTNLASINKTQLRGCLIANPPQAESARIVKKLEELMSICDKLKVSIKKTQTTQLHLADAMAEQAIN